MQLKNSTKNTIYFSFITNGIEIVDEKNIPSKGAIILKSEQTFDFDKREVF